MTPRIALVSEMTDTDEALWLRVLNDALGGEPVVSFRQLDPGDYPLIDIGIVAGPCVDNLAKLPNLKWVHSLWAGVERLVAEYGDAGIPIVRLVDGRMSRTMAESTLAWTYYLFRRMPTYAAFQRERRWEQLPYRPAEDVTVGVLGLGELGLTAAKLLRTAGFRVAGWSRSPKSVAEIETHHGAEGLEAVLRRAEILVCLLPLTPDTRGLLNAGRLALLPENAGLINFARGPLIVADDLLAALDAGKLYHAVLDVFDVEPLPGESRFWSHPRVSVLPHISAPTPRESAAATVAANIRRYRRKRLLPTTVDVARGY